MLKILYVDDERENLFSFRASLRRDFDIITASSATEALELLELEDIGVLVSDQRMPGMSGVELLSLARARWPGVSRILVTGYSDITAVIQAINQAQIYQYVSKPWDVNALKLILQNARKQAELLRENQTLYEEKYRLELASLHAGKAEAEARWEALQNKLQPHFLFNALNTIPPLIKADPPQAVHFTQTLSQLLRRLLSGPEMPLSALAEEIQIARDYLFLQSIRFEQKIKVSWQIPDILPLVALPHLSLQMLLENAFKHNEISREKPLDLQIRYEPDTQCLTVANSLQPRPGAEDGPGIGLDNIRKRYRLLGAPEPEIRMENKFYTVKLACLPLKHE